MVEDWDHPVSFFDEKVLDKMAWAKPQFRAGEIDRAGEVLASLGSKVTEEQFDFAMRVVNNWRAIHNYPLQAMKMTLKSRARRIDPGAIVAQRLKRLASIRLKLSESKRAGHHPNLSQMQDIGGCRAVLETVDQVRVLEKMFDEASKKSPNRGPQYQRTTDYLLKPKSSGYRGVHLVYRYRTSSPMHSCYNGQRIEIQLRSKLQHYWATAVETYSTFSGEALKSNIGPDSWKRFFALMSTAMAVQEGCPTVEGAPETVAGLLPELKSLHTSLNVEHVLSGWSVIRRLIAKSEDVEMTSAALYLLILDPKALSIEVLPYSSERLMEANERYEQIEKGQPELQAVLVSVDSLDALETAYPNYYLDTAEFLRVVNEVIST